MPFWGNCSTNVVSVPLLSKNSVSAFQISCKLLCFTLKDSRRKNIHDQSSFITKGSIYHIKHMYIQHFPIVDGTEIGCFYGRIYYVLYLQNCRYSVLLGTADLLPWFWEYWEKNKFMLICELIFLKFTEVLNVTLSHVSVRAGHNIHVCLKMHQNATFS